MSRDAYKPQYTYLSIAMGGVHGNIGSNISCTMYDRRLTPYFGDMIEGGVVVDKRPCLEHEFFVKMVVSGPMLKEDLPNGTKEVFDFSIPRDQCQQPCTYEDQFSSMDYVSKDIYLAIWRKAGAKIGKRVGDTIQWEDGQVSAIPSEESRWSES